jgi:hypothetical protein
VEGEGRHAFLEQRGTGSIERIVERWPRCAAISSCTPYEGVTFLQPPVNCGNMNREDAFHQVTEYWALVQKASNQPLLSGERRAMLNAASQKLPTINKILRDLGPDLRPIRASRVRDHLAAQPYIERALRILGSWHAMISLQQVAGEPVLPMSALDPVVSEVALPLWLAAKYRQAVNDAATNLNSFAQARIGRHDISDKDLMAQAFSDKSPEEGKARLRCPGSPESETVRSQQEGARAFSIGAFQAIRNPAHHLTGDWNPALAFQHLVALSQVAYWFRNWDVSRYTPPAPDYVALSEYFRAQTRVQQSLPPSGAPRTGTSI